MKFICSFIIICLAFITLAEDSDDPSSNKQSSAVIKAIHDCNNKSSSTKAGKIFTPVASFGIHAFATYFMPILIALGVLGNILSFIILKESALRIPGHLYLLCLTVFDSLSVLCLIPTFYAVLILRPYQQYLDPNKMTWAEKYLQLWGICQVRMFVSFFFRTMSIYTIVLFTIERWISVLWPMVGDRFSSARTVWISLGVLAFCSIWLNVPWFFSFDRFVVPCSLGRIVCKGNHVLFINRLIEFILFCLVPSIVIFVCNICIIVVLKRRHNLHTLHDKDRLMKIQTSITRRLLAISSAFVILTIPVLIFITLHTHSEFQNSKSHLSGPLADGFHLSFVLFVVNLCVNFVLYCLTGPAFRRAALAILRCRLDEMRYYRRTLIDGASAPGTQQTGNSSDNLNSRRNSEDALELAQPLVSRKEGSIMSSVRSNNSAQGNGVDRNTSTLSQDSRVGLLPPIKKETSM